MKVAGMSAAVGAAGGLPTNAAEGSETQKSFAPKSQFPKLALITEYSEQKLAFATQSGYEGVVVKVGKDFHPDLSDSAIENILSVSRNTGCRIISIECMFDAQGAGINHIASNPVERQSAQQKFVRCLEFGHRLGCKFIGTFSGGIPGADFDRQANELATGFNERYLPVCEKLDVTMGWENYPDDINFATVPAAWHAVFSRVASHRLGLEFDPSHLIRQYIDPYAAAWEFRDRILAVHFKDTEITEPVLQQVGILGKHWWRYRIPGQGLIDWPRFITVLLQAGFNGGAAVEHEDVFWDVRDNNGHVSGPEFPQARKDGFILAARFLRQYLPGRL